VARARPPRLTARSSVSGARLIPRFLHHACGLGPIDDPCVEIGETATSGRSRDGRPPTDGAPACAGRPGGRRTGRRAHPHGWPRPAFLRRRIRGRPVHEAPRRPRSPARVRLPSAAGELSAAKIWGTGAPAAAARCWTSASSSMPACTSSGGPVRRINARRSRPATASNAQVVRLAPPVKVLRFSTTTPSPSTGRSTDSSCSFTSAQNRRAAGPPGGSGSPRRLR
jgi:hypothetical protein